MVPRHVQQLDFTRAAPSKYLNYYQFYKIKFKNHFSNSLFLFSFILQQKLSNKIDFFIVINIVIASFNY